MGVTLRTADGVDRPWDDIVRDLGAATDTHTLDGPEPTQSRWLLRALTAARRSASRVVLVTNGAALTSATRLQQLIDAGLTELCLSIRDVGAHHDAQTAPGAFRQVLRAHQRAQEAGGLAVSFRVEVDDAQPELPTRLHGLFSRLRPRVVRFWRDGRRRSGPEALETLERLVAVTDALGIHAVADGFANCAQSAAVPNAPLRWPAASLLLRGIPSPQRPAGCVSRTPEGTDALAGGSRLPRGPGAPEDVLLGLAAAGLPVQEAPLCLDGGGAGPGARVAACKECGATACQGVPTAWASWATAAVGPRIAWQPLSPGGRVVVVAEGNNDPNMQQSVLPLLVQRLADAGFSASLRRRAAAEPDVSFYGALAADEPACVLLAGWGALADWVKVSDITQVSRIMVIDFHMLKDVSRCRAACASLPGASEKAWLPGNVDVLSCFPSYVHLYLSHGVPLRSVQWFPYAMAETSWGLPPSASSFVFCGGNHLRDWATLEAAAALLADDDVHSVVTTAPIEVQVRAVGPLVFRGRVDYASFVGLLQTSRFVVVTLQTDPHRAAGITVVAMALAAGRPVVATDTPAMRDHIRHGVSGLLVPPGDAPALAEAISRLDQDEALLEQLAEGARAAGRALSVDAWVEALVNGFSPRLQRTAGSAEPWMPW